MQSFCFPALVSALACVWATPAHAQALGQGAPDVIGTWNGKAALRRDDSVSFTLVLQPNAVGYWASHEQNPFTYSFTNPNRLQLSYNGKLEVYWIEFLSADAFHILPWSSEVSTYMASAVFRRQRTSVSTP